MAPAQAVDVQIVCSILFLGNQREFKHPLMRPIPRLWVGSESKSPGWHLARIYPPAAVIMFTLAGESVK